jgi:Leu/Phe-tRNA-protein transferase
MKDIVRLKENHFLKVSIHQRDILILNALHLIEKLQKYMKQEQRGLKTNCMQTNN